MAALMIGLGVAEASSVSTKSWSYSTLEVAKPCDRNITDHLTIGLSTLSTHLTKRLVVLGEKRP